jgi:hypothetical protein
MRNQYMVGGILLVVTHSGLKHMRKLKTSGYNVRGRIVQGRNVWGRNVWGRIVPVPISLGLREVLAKFSPRALLVEKGIISGRNFFHNFRRHFSCTVYIKSRIWFIPTI